MALCKPLSANLDDRFPRNLHNLGTAVDHHCNGMVLREREELVDSVENLLSTLAADCDSTVRRERDSGLVHDGDLCGHPVRVCSWIVLYFASLMLRLFTQRQVLE